MKATKGEFQLVKGLRSDMPAHLVPDGYWYDGLNMYVLYGAVSEAAPMILAATMPNVAYSVCNIIGQPTRSYANKVFALNFVNIYAAASSDFSGATAIRRLSTVFTGAGTGVNAKLTIGGNFTGTSTFDVEIVTGTTFRYRTDGGAWSASITITLAPIVLANGATVLFYALTGFTAADVWATTYVATDWVYSAPAGTSYLFPFVQHATVVHGSGVFWVSQYRPVQWLADGQYQTLSSTAPAGRYMIEFFEHLVVANVTDADGLTPLSFRVQWSDVFDFTDWTPTTTNEADFYDLELGNTLSSETLGITGLTRIGSAAYIYARKGIWRMRYVGMPLVMQIERVISNIGNIFPHGVASYNNKDYFWSDANCYVFDGNSDPKPIGDPMRIKFFVQLLSLDATKRQFVTCYVNEFYETITWLFPSRDVGGNYCDYELIYNIREDAWSVLKRGNKTVGLTPAFQRYEYFGCPAGVVQRPIIAGETGITQTGGWLRTKDYVYSEGMQAEVDTLIVDFTTTSGELPVFASVRQFLKDSTTWDYVGKADRADPEKRLSLPHNSGRVFAYWFGMTGPSGATNSPPADAGYNAWSMAGFAPQIKTFDAEV